MMISNLRNVNFQNKGQAHPSNDRSMILML